MSSIKYINSLMLTIMLLMPFTSNCLNQNKIIKNHSVNLTIAEENKEKNIEEKQNNPDKPKKRVKLRPEKEVTNIYKINI